MSDFLAVARAFLARNERNEGNEQSPPSAGVPSSFSFLSSSRADAATACDHAAVAAAPATFAPLDPEISRSTAKGQSRAAIAARLARLEAAAAAPDASALDRQLAAGWRSILAACIAMAGGAGQIHRGERDGPLRSPKEPRFATSQHS